MRNFAHVPDERLEWQPVAGAKSALRVAAHTALYDGRFVAMIRERRLLTPDDIDDWVARCEAEEAEVATRAQVERVFREGTAEEFAALDGLSPDDLSLTLGSGQGWEMPMSDLIELPGWHATLHTGQIDYLQTCWGDHQIYLG